MKGRSHRFQTHYNESHDDWVDGSWTVDCVCGVNFDDGEEMVNCDECGVWVHTRCSRYVKGDESFACDKCKAKNDYNKNSRNYDDSEETEVAQLLVELPTKTIRLEGSYAAGQGGRLRLWNDIPMEERVHVQGVPGGDPKLFKGLSSVFSPQLWKCTGHVPKKFNFQYREFPSWDEDGTRNEEGNDNTVDKGAGVLFSLSKESLQTPVTALGGLRRRNKEGRFYRNVQSRDPEKGWEGKMEEGNLIRPVSRHSGETKKEDLGTRRDPSSKKRARTADKEADGRRRSPHTNRTAFTSTSDAKSLEFYGERGSKSFKTDGQSTNRSLTEPVMKDHESTCYVAAQNGCDIPENNIALLQHSLENLPSSFPRLNSSSVAGFEVERDGLEVPARSSPIDFDVTTTFLEQNNVGRLALKREVDEVSNSDRFYNAEGSACNDLTLPGDKLNNFTPEVKSNQTGGDGNRSKVKPEAHDSRSIELLTYESSPGDTKGIGLLSDNSVKNLKTSDAFLSRSPPSNLIKAQELDGNSEALGACHTDKATCKSCQLKQDLERSEGPAAVQKCPIETNSIAGATEEFSKSDGNTSSSPAFPTQHKIALSVGKSHFTSSTAMISRTTSSDGLRSADTPNSDPDTRQQVTPDCSAGLKKDQVVTDVTRDHDRPDLPATSAKEHPKSYLDSASKVSESNKILHTSVPRRTQSESKDFVVYSSTKASSAHNSCETARSLQNESSSYVQNKLLASALPSKGEKFSQSNPSKGNPSLSMNPSAPTHSPANISDEELALLLHQQLNSSPRVPRVPRVPHLASPSGTGILTKRSSSSGAKDHNPFLRRKSKHASKYEYGRAHEIDVETKRTGRMLSPPDRRKQDTGHSADALPKMEENGSPTAMQYVKKNYPPASASTGNSGPSSSAEVNDHHLSHNSSRDISDEDTGTVRVTVHRTLPSLISEIMSKGRRMTYEELCNAVLPHWPNLRKHNGERYAYSSHSQAVLDCLRNRHEWARLVDRGPKTNPSRKRRKFDAEESEDNDYGRGRCVKEGDGKSIEAQREEFPKGKRKARKRRRLALQGRGIKDARKRRKSELLTDDDESGQFSNSSEESLFSEDEVQDSGASSIHSESSASSDDAETT